MKIEEKAIERLDRVAKGAAFHLENYRRIAASGQHDRLGCYLSTLVSLVKPGRYDAMVDFENSYAVLPQPEPVGILGVGVDSGHNLSVIVNKKNKKRVLVPFLRYLKPVHYSRYEGPPFQMRAPLTVQEICEAFPYQPHEVVGEYRDVQSRTYVFFGLAKNLGTGETHALYMPDNEHSGCFRLESVDAKAAFEGKFSKNADLTLLQACAAAFEPRHIQSMF